jgi:hypothetical protein
VFGHLAGYEDVNDAERLRHDPRDALDCWRQSDFGLRDLAKPDEPLRDAMAHGGNEPFDAHRSFRPMDRQSSCPSSAKRRRARHGFEREPNAWRTGDERLERQFGDLERCALRPGNVHSADGWDEVLKPVVARYRGKVSRIYFRADAGFASPEVYEFLEAEGIKYAFRLPANRVLQGRIGYLLKRPVGPPHEVRRSCANFAYQAGSWTKPRRVIAKVEWHPGELYPRVGFIVTNMARPSENVVAFYNKRGTCEQWIKEGKGAIKWTRLSCRSFAANAVRLQLHALAYNLGNFLRTLATPEPIKDWSLTSLKEKLIKIGAKVISHGRYVAFQMAEVAIPRTLFADILRLIAELRPPPDPAPA